MQNFSFVSLDFETTGLAESAEIIEIGMVKVENGQITARFEQLVKPHAPIPSAITALTGITNDMVKDAPYWSEVQAELLAFIGDHLLVAHNVAFDRSMLENHLGYETQNSWLDTHDLAKIFLPTLTSYKLISIAGALDIHSDDFHRASTDAEICAKVLLAIIAIGEASDPFTLQKIADIFIDDTTGLGHILRKLAQKSISGAVVGRDYSRRIETPSLNLGDAPKLTFAGCDAFFRPDGLMSQASDAFQYRPQQLGMLETIIDAFSHKKHGIIEAGTGTGKSFAYLVPSLLWAFENNTRVIISTNTIALQEQLFGHDIPFLKQLLGYDFPVALSKGRSNYLCLRRQELYKTQIPHMIWQEKIFFAAITYWLSTTHDGDKETLNLNRLEHQFWANIQSQPETCLGNRCPYFRRCYFMNTKQRCEQSQLIITNHALLLQDVKLDGAVLPSYDHVIVDEAHNLEDEATKQFTETLDLEFLRKTSRQLIRRNSIIHRLLAKLANDPLAGSAIETIHGVLAQLNDDVTQTDTAITTAIDYLFSIDELSRSNEWRITQKERQGVWWPEFIHQLEQIGGMISTIGFRLEKIYNALELIDSVEDLARELMFSMNWYKAMHNFCQDFISGENLSKVYWIEYTATSWGRNLSYSIAPINPMPLLKDGLFDKNDSVILTSATLAVNNNLTYTAGTYFLQAEDFVSYITPSPFDYQNQSLIAVPTDNPDYSQCGENQYAEMVIRNLEQIIPAVTGGVLVLFTSYAMLNKVYFALKQNPAFDQYNILAHGQDGSRTSIIQSMTNISHTIVLGAASFWEGIDVKGSGLTTVVIVKLPFQPPTRAITAAKLEYLQSQGKNSFNYYSLPQAILKFRQGCGRLIRTHTDWGVIIILDNRVLTKRYGSQFLASLPKQTVLKGPLDKICAHLNSWMAEKSGQ